MQIWTRLLVLIHLNDVIAMGTGWTTTGIGRRDVTDGDFVAPGKNRDNQMFSISLIKLRNASTPIPKEPALNGLKDWIRRAHMQIQVGWIIGSVCSMQRKGKWEHLGAGE